MARKGRELELLIEKLESCTLPIGTTINSPGFINDKVTGQPREVDILVEYQLGTVPIKIIIECRDRKSIQDTQWIEQIATKANDLNVNKVIAVSSSKFSKPAIAKANHYGIEARLLEEVDTDTIAEWWKVNHLEFLQRKFLIIAAQIYCEKPELVKELLEGKNADDKFINRISDNQVFSLHDILGSNLDKINRLNQLILNGPSIRINLNFDYPDPKSHFLLRSAKGESKITLIHMVAEFRLISEQIPVSRVQNYRNTEKVISEVIEFDNVPLGENNVLQLIKNPDGSISLSARKK